MEIKVKSTAKYIQIIIKFVLIIFLLLSCYIIMSSKITGTTQQLGGFQFVTVITGSMKPEIQPGSLILIKKINDPANLKINDIITFQSPRNRNLLITHRIVDIKKTDSNLHFITKGDANSASDAREIDANHILGKYQKNTIPYIGFLLEFTKTKMGYVIFFVIPLFLLLFSSVGRFWTPTFQKNSISGGGMNENQNVD